MIAGKETRLFSDGYPFLPGDRLLVLPSEKPLRCNACGYTIPGFRQRFGIGALKTGMERI